MRVTSVAWQRVKPEAKIPKVSRRVIQENQEVWKSGWCFVV